MMNTPSDVVIQAELVAICNDDAVAAGATCIMYKGLPTGLLRMIECAIHTVTARHDRTQIYTEPSSINLRPYI